MKTSRDFSLFDIYLVSAGQEQSLDTGRATNEQVQKTGPMILNKIRKIKLVLGAEPEHDVRRYKNC